MANEFNTYDPREVSFTFAGAKISQFMDGTFIEVERKNDTFTMHEGSNGDITRTRIRSRAGHYTITLMAQGSDNDLLQAIMDDDEQFGTGLGTCQVQDHSGLMECHSQIAWVRKRPKIDRAKEAGGVQWIIDAADVEIIARGNLVPIAF